MFTAENGKIQQFVDVTVIGRGQFVAYCSKRPMHVYLDGNEGNNSPCVGARDLLFTLLLQAHRSTTTSRL